MEEIQPIEPNRDCEICLSIMDNHADNLKDAAQDCPVHSVPGAMNVEDTIKLWQEEFGAAIDEAIGDGEGVASMVMVAGDKSYRTAHYWLNRDSDGSMEYLNWEVTQTVSDKVGLRYVSVWKNNYPSENKGAYGWEVRMGGAQLGVSGGVGMEKLVGYSDTLNNAKTDGMKALLEVNRIVELKAEEKKKMAEMISAPMMDRLDDE